MNSTIYKFIACAFLLGCSGRESVQCVSNADCNLSGGGLCTLAGTGNRWCSYPDPDCAGGYRFADQAVGDNLGGACVGAASGKALWARQLGSPGGEGGSGIAIDGDNIVAVGGFGETIVELGLTSNGRGDIYIVKLESGTGNVLWAKSLGGAMNDSPVAVAVDSSKGIYIAAIFEGSVDFGSGPIVSEPDGSGVVLKLDPNGSLQWATKIGARNVSAIAVNGEAVAITGEFHGSFVVNAQTFTSVDESPDVFVLKLNASNGTTEWGKPFGGSFLDSGSSIGIDSSSNIVVTGYFERTVDFGGGPLTAAGVGEDGDGFWLKVAPDGRHLLSKRFGGDSADSGNALAIDAFNNVFVVGTFRETADLGCSKPLATSSPGQSDIFVAKYTQAGSCQWAMAFGGMGTRRTANAVSVNPSGDVAIVGEFCGSITFGGGILTSASACDRFKVDAFGVRLSGMDGSHLNSVRAGGADNLHAADVVQSPDGRFFMTGNFQGFAEFGDQTLTSLGAEDAFIAGFDRL